MGCLLRSGCNRPCRRAGQSNGSQATVDLIGDCQRGRKKFTSLRACFARRDLNFSKRELPVGTNAPQGSGHKPLVVLPGTRPPVATGQLRHQCPAAGPAGQQGADEVKMPGRQHALAIGNFMETAANRGSTASCQGGGNGSTGHVDCQGPGQFASQELMDQGIVAERLLVGLGRQAHERFDQGRPLFRREDVLQFGQCPGPGNRLHGRRCVADRPRNRLHPGRCPLPGRIRRQAAIPECVGNELGTMEQIDKAPVGARGGSFRFAVNGSVLHDQGVLKPSISRSIVLHGHAYRNHTSGRFWRSNQAIAITISGCSPARTASIFSTPVTIDATRGGGAGSQAGGLAAGSGDGRERWAKRNRGMV